MRRGEATGEGMNATLPSMAVVVLLALPGCGRSELVPSSDLPPNVLSALQAAESYELLSLDPNPELRGEAGRSGFHGWHVLGRTAITDVRVQQKLNSALQAGVQENDGTVAACFEPHHGISVVSRESTTDLVICFACFSAQVYVNGAKGDGFLTTGSPQPVFDKVLREANVPLAVPAE